MQKLNKAIKYRMYPTDDQAVLIRKTFGCARFIWNQMLADSIRFLDETGIAFIPTPARYKQEFPFLKEVDAFALCNAQINLKSAYTRFFRDKNAGFPNYKSKKHSALSYTTNAVYNNIVLGKNTIKLPKLGLVKINKYRCPKAGWILKSATISLKNDKYYASVLFEYQADITPVEPKTSIGLDYSSPSFYVDNNGNKPNSMRFYRSLEEKLSRAQRKLSHMKNGSNNYKEQLRRVRTIQEQIANRRKDALHKLSTEIANRYDVVCLEDLDLHNMAQSLHFGKAIGDNGFGTFRSMLEYKLCERGKYIVFVDKWFPSTKTCHRCGYKNKEIALKDRVWVCPNCGSVLNRDINAAQNIKEEGLRLLRAQLSA